MHEWTGNTVDYTLEDGCISMIPSKSYGGNLYTKDEYGNFVYRFEFQLTPGANNGVGIRTPMEGDAAYVGMEIQILDCEHPIYKDITPLRITVPFMELSRLRRNIIVRLNLRVNGIMKKL